jgi:arylsulfatase A-like enzyme
MPLIGRRTFLAALGASSFGAARSRPNIVFVLMDDMGWADFSAQGSDFYETPTMDRLAAQGMRFTQGYAACPVCSPTRASIMTGKYPARLHLTNFIPGRSPRPFARLVPPQFAQQLPLEEATIAEVLAAAGYATACIGKWHLGGEGYSPDRQGFQLSFSTGGGHSSPKWTVNRPHVPREGEWRSERQTEEAEKFLEANRGRPVFLYLTYHLPHIPLDARAEIVAKYEVKLNQLQFRSRRDVMEPSQNIPLYAAMMEMADEGIGRVLKKLDELKQAENTVVILTSDNGGLTAPEYQKRPVTSNRPLREGKGHLYEGGIRVPWIVRWPAVVKAGTLCDDPVSSVDFYSTLLEIAGVSDVAGHVPDGRSFVPLLKGAGRMSERPLFWHYPHYSNQGGAPAGAVRLGDFKLIEFYEDNHVELYDLRKDPGEKNNLAASAPARADRLRKTLLSWRGQVQAHMPEGNPRYDTARQMDGLNWTRPAPR